MTRDDIEIFANENELEIPMFDSPSYDTAIIGLSINNEVVYDYDLMVDYLVKQDNCTVEDAIDFIEYNTIRALPYCLYRNKPIVVRREL